MITLISLEPMTLGAVAGARNGFQELGRYLEHLPLMFFKDYELKLFYIMIPSIISLASVIVIFFEKRREVLVMIPFYIFMYILCLIPYLLLLETLVDTGV